MRFLVTGAAGQLGSVMVDRLSPAGDVFAMRRNDLDITQAGDVDRVFRETCPDVVVNCSAYNQVDAAEEQAAQALEVNAFGVLALARAARTSGALLIHYSTDFVFDGETARSYTEDDAPSPQSNYGLSKLLGEWFAADSPSHYVLRVESLFGGRPAKSSVDRILDAIRQGQPTRVFTDRTVTPSYVVDVAEATLKIVQSRPAPGLYHCVNSGTTTWLGVAQEVARLLSVQPTLVPVEMASVPFPAKRPRYCALSNEKLRAVGIHMPDWREALARYVQRV
ncbi:MAG TPA: dTDP-4-dehydrorhamnose reductase [Vicinamibacterales bacterium]|nr:dTDP-4-dehydrorhamnose reductase [Vicinamibacterales bacterium]